MSSSNAIFWTIITLSGLMSYSIGANDAANALGTSYGSNATKLWLLLGLGAICEFVGAVWCSSKVARLAENLLPTMDVVLHPEVQERLMLAVCISSFSFILFSSVFAVPISGTHTVIGALIGAGLAALEAKKLNWHKLGMTVAGWFVSPIMAAALTSALFLLICSVTLGGHVKNPFWQMQFQTLISACAWTFAAYMVISLAFDEPTALMWEISLPSFFLGGIFFARGMLAYAANKVANSKFSFCEWVGTIFAFWSF